MIVIPWIAQIDLLYQPQLRSVRKTFFREISIVRTADNI